MKVPVLSAVAILSLLAVHSVQGAALGSSEEESTLGTYAAKPEAFNPQFLHLEKLKSALNPDEFLDWHALFESIKKKLPFLNWEALPKLKGMRSAAPDVK